MENRCIVIPNSKENFIIGELKERLLHEQSVTIPFGGDSMLPTINGESDLVVFERLDGSGNFKRGDIYLFEYNGCCIVHRLLRQRGDRLLFMGDNSMRVENVDTNAVLAHLVAIKHEEGGTTLCSGAVWKRKSRAMLLRRELTRFAVRLFSKEKRGWQRWLYLFMLLFLMWAPLNGLGVPLNNFVFGIRLDHLLHASVYIPCSFFIMDFAFLKRGKGEGMGKALLLALLIAFTTETVQYYLPYRGFDINDMVANFLGVSLGWLVVRMSLKKTAGRGKNTK